MTRPVANTLPTGPMCRFISRYLGQFLFSEIQRNLHNFMSLFLFPFDDTLLWRLQVDAEINGSKNLSQKTVFRPFSQHSVYFSGLNFLLLLSSGISFLECRNKDSACLSNFSVNLNPYIHYCQLVKSDLSVLTHYSSTHCYSFSGNCTLT